MLQEDVRKRFGRAVKNWRGKSGISQEELAWRAGLHRSYVADIERGVRNASLVSIEKLALALQISFSKLVDTLSDAPAEIPEPAVRAAIDSATDIIVGLESPAAAQAAEKMFQQAGVRNRIHIFTSCAAVAGYLFTRPPADAGARPPGIVLLDLGLPRGGALDLLRQIKKDARTRHLPVIILTAKNEAIAESRRLGADQHLIKPLDFPRFCEVIARVDCQWILVGPKEPTGGGTP